MRKLLLSGVAFSVLAIAPAMAADIFAPVYKAAPAALIYNWTGFYAGLNAGYSWGHTNSNYTQGPALFGSGFTGPLSEKFSPNNFIGGGQLGYNYQAGAWVFGMEADFAWRNGKDTTTFIIDPAPAGFNDSITRTDEQKWVGTVRGRLGVAPPSASNWLFYATGGLAFGKFEHAVTQFCNIACNLRRSFSDSPTKVGWTLGGGVEVALNRNWSIGAEYLHMSFGTDTLNIGPTAPTFSATTVSFRDRSNVARAKLNYRFGG